MTLVFYQNTLPVWIMYNEKIEKKDTKRNLFEKFQKFFFDT